MKRHANKRILLIIPEQLLEMTDEAAERANVSRLAIVRRALLYYLTQLGKSHTQELNGGLAPFRMFSSLESDGWDGCA